MKVLAIFTFIVLLAGCVGSAIVIPDYPRLEQIQADRLTHFVCFDKKNEEILQRNMKAVMEYAVKLREELLRKQKEEKSWD